MEKTEYMSHKIRGMAALGSWNQTEKQKKQIWNVHLYLQSSDRISTLYTGGEQPQGPKRELPSSKVEMRCLGFMQDLS